MDKNFLWGSATAAYQCEGAWQEGNKAKSVWDVFNHGDNPLNIHNTNGDVSSDFYHRYEEDIRMLKEGDQNTFRFSIAPTRIYADLNESVNKEGVEFYNRVIDCCLENGITPFVTLFHYDLPQTLQNRGGWLNREIVDWFTQYTKICFNEFGDRIRLWTTINEPHYYTYCSYIVGNYPPNM